MLSRTIAAFCIIDDALQAVGYKDDPQAKTPASAILTLAILAAMELGGKHNGRVKMYVSRCMCKRLCTGGIPLLKHLL
jgi:hypothetical protein